jgi:outer membrane autotransporter protein
VAPGGSIGTLTVAGNYTESASGTLSIEVSPNAGSQLKVGGAASLAGKLALAFDPGVYTPTAFKILTASSVSGTFSTVTGTNPTGLPQALLYDPADVTLQLSANTPTNPSTPLSPNTPTSPNTPSPTPTPIVIAPTNDTIYSAVTSTAILTAQQANGIILDRLGQRRAGVADGQVAALGGVAPPMQYAEAGNAAALGDFASALPRSLTVDGAWFRGIGGFASINGSSAAPGFTSETGGFLAGYDRPIAENIYLGVAGGYLHSNIDEHSTSNGVESSARFAVYGGARIGPSLLTATAGYAHDWFDTNRGVAGIGTAGESHDGDEATPAGNGTCRSTFRGFRARSRR